jgi:inorganic pyrophosphatase
VSSTLDGRFPNVVEIVVEIPRGSRNKYEFDMKAGVFRLDRVLSSAVFYNFDYGYVVGTLSRPIGCLQMSDEKGPDFKILCVAVADPHQAHVEKLADVRPHRLVEIENFFQTYKLLEDKNVDVVGWEDRERAMAELEADRRRLAG